jgi:20S proteasome alpha/beta subunit
LAADTLATWGSNRDGYCTKIAQRGDYLAATSGSLSSCQAFLDWFRRGMKGEPPTMPDGEATTHGAIITPEDQILLLTPRGWERTANDTLCMGSGSEFAQGAMAAGATPDDAVRIAMIYDTKSGGQISILRRNQSAALEVVDAPERTG